MSAEPIEAVKPNGNVQRKHRVGSVIGTWTLITWRGKAAWEARCTLCGYFQLVAPKKLRPCRQCTRMAHAKELGSIRSAVCVWFKITDHEIRSADRPARIARPRMLGMALSRELTKRSLPQIGHHYGGRDHTTVLHGVRRMAQLRKSDPEWESHYLHLKCVLTRANDEGTQ